MERYKRKAVFSELKKFDIFAKDSDFIEVIEWHNGEGFDVEISSSLPERFQLTWGEFKALKKMVKELEKFEDNDN